MSTRASSRNSNFVTRQKLEIVFFFFSSRRRHTISYGDWSSDVCSSDLPVRGRKGAGFRLCRTEHRSVLHRRNPAPLRPLTGLGSPGCETASKPRTALSDKIDRKRVAHGKSVDSEVRTGGST